MQVLPVPVLCAIFVLFYCKGQVFINNARGRSPPGGSGGLGGGQPAGGSGSGLRVWGSCCRSLSFVQGRESSVGFPLEDMLRRQRVVGKVARQKPAWLGLPPGQRGLRGAGRKRGAQATFSALLGRAPSPRSIFN